MQYISNTDNDKKEMLKAIGVSSFEGLVSHIPSSLRKFDWKVPKGSSELELFQEMVQIGKHNHHFHDHTCFLGAGNYDHFIPTVVNHLAHRGEFITSYTPYQGEASQGTLQFVYEYQSLICELLAMDHSNASMYDGASSLAEGVLLALRSGDKKKILLPATLHPEYRAVVETYTSALDRELITIPAKEGVVDAAVLAKLLDASVAAVVLQQPNFFGHLEDAAKISELAHGAGALLIACVNPISLGAIEPPGSYGADIAVGEGQPLGNAVSFGGPHFGIFTVKADLLRKMPGRICGMTVDKKGRRSFVLTLQAREQHIRREKATSNICTNHSLCALKAAIYLSLLGRKGVRKVSYLNMKKAHDASTRLTKIKGVRLFSEKPFFNEFALVIDRDAAKLKKCLHQHKILGPLDLSPYFSQMKNTYLVAVTENRSDEDVSRLAAAIEEAI